MRRFLFGLALVALFASMRSLWPRQAQPRRSGSSTPTHPSYDEIALRAYFIGLDRDARGEKSDPLRDWAEAEHELLA